MNVPAVLNVRVSEPELMLPIAAGAPGVASNVTLCVDAAAAQVHCTEPPRAMFTCCGEKKLSATCTCAGGPGATAVVVKVTDGPPGMSGVVAVTVCAPAVGPSVRVACAVPLPPVKFCVGVIDPPRWSQITKAQRGPFDIDERLKLYQGLHIMHFGADDLEVD